MALQDDESDLVVSEPSPADSRDDRADGRDHAAKSRDHGAVARDRIADQRDDSAHHRDQLADQRDEAALRSTIGSTSSTSAAQMVLAETLRHAGHDRRRAMQDRQSSAHDRLDAGRDRRGATVDRDDAATDRKSAGGDRDSAALDPLTGVFLRRAGMIQLEREMARSTRADAGLVLAFVDVDHLKVVNDTLGHPVGDELLRTVATLLGTHLRAEDLTFRYGGDEFVCACVGLTMANTYSRFDDVRVAMAGQPVHGSISIGLATFRAPESASDLIRRADTELYRSRRRPLTPQG
jgi:diguanylate cyclase (GGDEF)-like protein